MHHSKDQEKKKGTLGHLQRYHTRGATRFSSFSGFHFNPSWPDTILDHSRSRSLCTGIGVIEIFARRFKTGLASPSCPVRSMHFLLQY